MKLLHTMDGRQVEDLLRPAPEYDEQAAKSLSELQAGINAQLREIFSAV